MLRLAPLLITCLTLITCCSEARADLVLVLDTVNETLSLTGSTSGVLSQDSVAAWELGDSSGGSLAPLVFNFENDISGGFFFSSTGLSLDVIENTANEPITLTAAAENNTFSIANFSNDEITFLESQVGNSLSLIDGDGFDDIGIAAAVPEPTSAVVLCSALAVLAIRRKRS